jgi:protein-arginine kinase activator protein McsA
MFNYVESIVRSYLFDDDGVIDDKGKVIYAVTMIIASDYREKFLSNVCPFCNKQFSSRKTLKVHLAVSSCNAAFNELVTTIARSYGLVKGWIRHWGSNKRGGFALDINIRVKFRNKDELARWIIEHRDVVLEAIKNNTF